MIIIKIIILYFIQITHTHTHTVMMPSSTSTWLVTITNRFHVRQDMKCGGHVAFFAILEVVTMSKFAK